MRICLAIVAAAGLASCAGTFGRSGVSAPQTGRPVLGSGRVSIPVYREHYTTRETKGGLMTALAGVGSHEVEGEQTSIDKVDQLGSVIVDVRTGTCELAPAPAPEIPSGWETPVQLLAGEFYEAPGARLYRAEQELVASIGDRSHVVIQDPQRRAMWLRGTDAIVGGGELIDLVHGQTWRYDAGIARVEDHVWFSTGDSIVELTAAPISQVAVYTPEHMLPPVTWLAPAVWKPGEVHRGITLAADGAALVAADGHTVLGPLAGAVYWYESVNLAQGSGWLLDLETGKALDDVPGYPRVGRMVTGNYLLESAGQFWSTTRELDEAHTFDRLRLIGFDGTAFVFDRSEHDAILVFDVATRQWHDHRYARCTP